MLQLSFDVFDYLFYEYFTINKKSQDTNKKDHQQKQKAIN